jgi:hypothetical protein
MTLGYWTLRGIEVGLLVLLIDAAVLGVLRLDAGGGGTLLALAVTFLPFVRADGIVPALLVGGYGWAFTRRRTSHTWIFVALPIAVVAAHTGSASGTTASGCRTRTTSR